jgi:phage tail tape-measure protein
LVGEALGYAVGALVGEALGYAVGALVGEALGYAVGALVGDAVGYAVGNAVGSLVGEDVGTPLHFGLKQSPASSAPPVWTVHCQPAPFSNAQSESWSQEAEP